MMQSGHYYPAASWLVPHGGKGMDPGKFQAAWRMFNDPNCKLMCRLNHIGLKIGRIACVRASLGGRQKCGLVRDKACWLVAAKLFQFLKTFGSYL
jgi:hypothetical protein